MIEVQGLTYRYPRAAAPALRDVWLRVSEGEVVVVAGDSGSGKSTLARALVGLVPHLHGGAMSGRVLVLGRDTRMHRPRDLTDVVGFVSQDPESQSVLDRVEDEVAFAMENLAVDPVVMRKRVEETLDALGIAPLRDRRMDTLSGGERQRVAIAAALASQPRALVLDEPTSQLDPQSAEDVLAAVQRLNVDLGIAIVLVEHRLERVVQHADRVVVMRDGLVVADDEPRAVLADGHVETPLSRLGRALGWQRMPLTVREGRALAAGTSVRAPGARADVAPGPVLVRARALRVARAGREIVRGVDLEVRAGEVVAVVGRNGSGKTTLLRALLGLAPVSAGRLDVAGLDPARVPVEALGARVAYLPQSADSILFHDTLRDEVRFTLRARSSAADADSEIDRAGLSAYAGRDPRECSAGERLRAALLAATTGSPHVLLLDEPTRGMDARGKDGLVSQVEQWGSAGAAVLLVTHDVELVARVATRVVLLSEGTVVLDGPTSSVLGESVLFSSQMNKVFGDRRIATVEQALEAVRA